MIARQGAIQDWVGDDMPAVQTKDLTRCIVRKNISYRLLTRAAQ